MGAREGPLGAGRAGACAGERGSAGARRRAGGARGTASRGGGGGGGGGGGVASVRGTALGARPWARPGRAGWVSWASLGVWCT